MARQKKATLKNILVIESNSELLELMQFFYTDHGYQVFIADNYARGLNMMKEQKLKSAPIDAIIIEARIKGVSWVEFLQAARALSPTTPLFAMHSNTPEISAKELSEQGAQGVLEKPFIWEEALEMLGRTLT